jgi:hypothetical protein
MQPLTTKIQPLPACLLVALLPASLRAQFTTIINVPPDIAPTSIGSNTQLNLFDGGSIGINFDAGATNGASVNVEVNVTGGSVANGFDAWGGSIINIAGGSITTNFNAKSGSQVNISGGSVGGGFVAFGGSTVNITGGIVGNFFDAASGSFVNISGGTIENGFQAFGGSFVNIVGAMIADGFNARNGSMVRISGNDFRLNGVPIDGLHMIGNIVELDIPADAVFTGVMADGRTFAFLPVDSDSFATGTLALEAAELPPAVPGVFIASTDPLPLGLRSGQTLIVDAGAIVGDHYNATPGSTLEVQTGAVVGNNLEAVDAMVNINGGSVGDNFDAAFGTVVHISGGTIGNGFDSIGSIVNISGGSVGQEFQAFDGSVVNITGGDLDFEFRAENGSLVNISGGSIGSFFAALGGSTVNISGGTFDDAFDALSGSEVRITGNEFSLNGVPIAGLEAIGNSVGVNIPAGAIFTGVMADGRTFAFSTVDTDDFSAGALTLEAAEVPAAMPGVFVAAADPLPLGVRAGQTLIVNAGAVVNDNFNAAPGSAIEVQFGGLVRENLEAAGAVVQISGGAIGNGFDAWDGSTVNLVGGSVGNNFEAFRGTTVNISGGSVGSQFEASDGSEVNITGGVVGTDFDVENGSLMNIAGGSVGSGFDALPSSTTNISGGIIGVDFDADSGSTVNIFGSQFTLGGIDITASLAEDMPFTITDRNVTLAGILADGTPFDFLLNSSNLQFNRDYFHAGATLTITLVSGIPGDYNDDGTVNAADYTVWRNALGTDVAVRGNGGDGNFDGRVTQADFFVWKKHYGESGAAGFADRFPFEVPEPAGVGLVLLGVIGFAAQRGRRSGRIGNAYPR